MKERTWSPPEPHAEPGQAGIAQVVQETAGFVFGVAEGMMYIAMAFETLSAMLMAKVYPKYMANRIPAELPRPLLVPAGASVLFVLFMEVENYLKLKAQNSFPGWAFLNFLAGQWKRGVEYRGKMVPRRVRGFLWGLSAIIYGGAAYFLVGMRILKRSFQTAPEEIRAMVAQMVSEDWSEERIERNWGSMGGTGRNWWIWRGKARRLRSDCMI